MKPYNRINFIEREEISRQLASQSSYRRIARILGRNVSSISREIGHCYSQNRYRAIKAQAVSNQKARNAKRLPKLETNVMLRKIVIEQLQEQWSPQQIANRLKVMYPNDLSMRVSHETIYAYLYVKPRTTLRKRLIKSLRREHKQRRSNKDRRKSTPVQDFISIDQRPEEAKDRIIPGHWEGDLLIGAMNRSALGALVERTTRKVLLAKLKDQSSATVRRAFARKFKQLPNNLKRSLTYDQGKEMAEHKLFTKQTKIQVYFADRCSPWQRGSSENTNGLLRQYFPKGIDFSKVSQQK